MASGRAKLYVQLNQARDDVTPMLDTLKVVKGLRDHFSQEQAEALAIVFSETATERFATKEDVVELKAEIAELRVELKAEIVEVKGEIALLRADFAQLKVDVAKWIFTAIGFNFLATAGLFLGFFKLFVK